MTDGAKHGIDGFASDLALMREDAGKSVPTYHLVVSHVLSLLESDPSLCDRLERVWAGRTFNVHYDRPLLLLAALRADAISTGEAHPLYRAIGTDDPDPGAATRAAVEASLAGDRERVYRALAERWVQTNDTHRSVIWRWPAWLAGCDGGARPLCLVDLGASAGLNLVAERLPAIWTDPRGAPIHVVSSIDAPVRLGLDARPVDLDDPESVNWLRACIWPGDRGRSARLEAGLRAFADARIKGEGPTLEKLDATQFASRLRLVSRDSPGVLVLAYQSYVRGYLPLGVRGAHREAMHDWLASLPPGQAIWVELEQAKSNPDGAVTVHFSRDEGSVVSFELARTEHHPVVVSPNVEVASILEETLRR